MQQIEVPRITGIPLPGRVWAVWVLLAAYVIVFVLTGLLSAALASDPVFGRAPYNYALLFLGWKDNDLIVQGEYWRLLTATFLHSGIFHLLMNSFSLYILGPDNERIYGTGRFLALYLLSGLSGSLASYAFNPAPSVGASGAIFGLFGGLAVFFLTTRHVLGQFGQRQLQGIGAILLINLFFGLSAPDIDNFGHLGGLLGGFVAGWILIPRYQVDKSSFPIRVMTRKNPLAWAGAAVMLLVLLVLAVVIIPPPFR